jgi:hypothetical protein
MGLGWQVQFVEQPSTEARRSFVDPDIHEAQVNLEEEFRGGQVLSCRSFCRAFSLGSAHLAENDENRILMSPLTSPLFQNSAMRNFDMRASTGLLSQWPRVEY